VSAPRSGREALARFAVSVIVTAVVGLVIVPGASAIRFTDDSYSVPEGVVGQDYSHRFEGEGGCGLPYQFRVLSGGLPPGLSLLDDGELVGIPTQGGRWSFWLELSDEDPPSEPWCLPRKSERAFTVNVAADLAVTTESAPPATVGTPYSLSSSSEGGNGTRTWSLASGELPPGLTLNPSSGAIAGTPTAAGVYEFRVRVSDGSRLASKQFTVPVREPLAVQASSVPAAEVGVPIAAVKLAATGGSSAKAWRLDGTLPRGLTFDARSGAITGTPEVAGSFAVKVGVSDSEGRTAGVDLTIAVSPRLTIAPTRLEPARTSRPYRATVTTLGGVEPIKFELLSGRLPAGVRLDPRTGALTGKPRTAGSYRLAIGARDALGATARRAFVLSVRSSDRSI
jgi:Putative Ig domain